MKPQIVQSFLPGRNRGFTIVEVVITFIIIGILTAVMVPTLINRSREAKIHACEQELQHLADAEERAAIDTGYLYRVFVLNDTDKPVTNDQTYKNHSILNLTNTMVATTNPNMKVSYSNLTTLFISTKAIAPKNGQDYYESGMQTTILSRLTSDITRFNWNGPYVNWSADANKNDWPDDPWGNDYLFFTRQGVIYPPDPNSTDNNTDKSFQFQTTGPPINGATGPAPAIDIFDRPTFLSLGPNGVPGPDAAGNPVYGQGDDIVRSFGGD